MKQNILPAAPIQEEPQGSRHLTPVSLPINIVETLYSYNGDGELLAKNHALVNRHNKFTEEKNGQYSLVSYESDNASLHIKVVTKYLQGGHNLGAQKLLDIIFEKALTNAFSMTNGQLITNTLVFPLTDLYGDNKAYSSAKSAIKGFDTAIDKIVATRLKGEQLDKATLDENGNPTNQSYATNYKYGNLAFITGGIIENGQCKIDLEKRLNWASLLSQYIAMPSYKYALVTNPYSLLRLIFVTIRQKTSEVYKQYMRYSKALKNGTNPKAISLTISWRKAIEALGLKPKLKKDGKPKDLRNDLIKPILDAIDTINAEEKNLKKEERSITLKATGFEDKASPKDIIANGKIKITIQPEYAKELSSRTAYAKKAQKALTEDVAADPAEKDDIIDAPSESYNIENQMSFDFDGLNIET